MSALKLLRNCSEPVTAIALEPEPPRNYSGAPTPDIGALPALSNCTEPFCNSMWHTALEPLWSSSSRWKWPRHWNCTGAAAVKTAGAATTGVQGSPKNKRLNTFPPRPSFQLWIRFDGANWLHPPRHLLFWPHPLRVKKKPAFNCIYHL